MSSSLAVTTNGSLKYVLIGCDCHIMWRFALSVKKGVVNVYTWCWQEGLI